MKEDMVLIRDEAIKCLQEYVVIDSEYCIVRKTRIKIVEKDELLEQLLNGDDYLKVPMALFFSSPFWRQLKVESNILCDKNGTRPENQ